MITLRVDICDQRRSYLVTFETGPDAETHALAFLKGRETNHAFSEVEDDLIDWTGYGYPNLYAYLYPTCEHGLSLDLCAGPQHYPYDCDELAAYGF